MFIGIMCLSLMARITTMMVCLQERKETMMENREIISLGRRANSMQRSKLRRDNAMHSPEVKPRSKRRTHRRSEGETFEHLENLLSKRDHKSQEEERK
jgi:hypothetical protein